jgi:phage baseplate assembly protein W
LYERRSGTAGTGNYFKHANESFKSITMAEPFTSIRHPFAVDLGRGRLAEEENYAEHVEQMMIQVLFTAPGERVNRPDFGCGIRRLVFAPNSEVSATLAQVTIYQALTNWLGSAIDVNDVKAQAIEERLEIKIAYTLKARGERRYLNLEVTR